MFSNKRNDASKSPNAIKRDFRELEQNNFYSKPHPADAQNQTYTLSLFSNENKSYDMTGNQFPAYYPDTSSAELASLADSPENQRLKQALARKQIQDQYMMKHRQMQAFPVQGTNNFRGNKSLAENMNNSISSSYEAGIISSSLEADGKEISLLTKKIENDIIQSFDKFEQDNKEK